MKYSMDTYRLYSSEKIFSFAIRVRGKMKEDVDIDVLRNAANTAVRRYPYFRKEIVLAEDGGYDLIPNGRDVVVIPTTEASLPLQRRSKPPYALYRYGRTGYIFQHQPFHVRRKGSSSVGNDDCL